MCPSIAETLDPHRVVADQWQRFWALSKTGLLDVRRFTSATLREWFGTRRSIGVWRDKRPSPERILTIETIVSQCRKIEMDVNQKKKLPVDRLGTEPPAVIRKENLAWSATRRCRSARWMRVGVISNSNSTRPKWLANDQENGPRDPGVRTAMRWKPLGLVLRRLHKYRVQFVRA